jgi:branched-chain amino acid transport system permease protein
MRFAMLAGAVNFAHAGFMGIGAYICATLVMKANLGFWFSIIVSAGCSALVAVIFGVVTLRLRGAYFFLVTFALSEIIRIVFSNYLVSLFGGVNGLVGIPAPRAIMGISFEAGSIRLLYVIALITLFCLMMMYSMERGYWGKVFQGISESHDLAEAIGVNLMKFKVAALAIAAFIAGIAGSLYGAFNGIITPEDFSYHLSLFSLVAIILGGRDHFLGPLLGVVVLVVLAELFRNASYYEPIIWGLCIIAVMMFKPKGLVGLITEVLSLGKMAAVKTKGR